MESYVRKLNDRPVRAGGEYVLYWIRAARRAESNPALVFAAGLANRLGLPVLAFENLAGSDPYGNDRYQAFLLQGAAELAAGLGKLGIGYTRENPFGRAAAVVTDDWPTALSQDNPAALDFQCYAVDSSCIVPHTAIPGRAYAAYSIRPKIHRLLPRFLKPVPPVRVERAFPRLGEIRTVHATGTKFSGGRRSALRCLRRFLKERLSRYSAAKNEPSAHVTSDLSPYLHFGYISALEVALAVRDYASEHRLMADEFLEELIVRRELAFNFAYHAAKVDSLDELPGWARQTLDAHRWDPRDPVYTPQQFENAATGDDLWNATQKELLLRGKIHGYYRMYWGKKILEWSATPEEALATMIHLHDRYALDGRDPNTYANILWCFGLHDRPWPERPIYGTVRSMARSGMDRKTDTAAYIREIEELTP